MSCNEDFVVAVVTDAFDVFDAFDDDDVDEKEIDIWNSTSSYTCRSHPSSGIKLF